uniref:uncharacterized protein LOC120325988 n=1 Tax=Styela clava TaxID=7725 RepID=UPI001939DF4A|nr:uncharacterized protein LOC120325988 [Styela clava]
MKPATRKRRAASLTAEALWNIQLEDDVLGKSAQFSVNANKKITLRESAKIAPCLPGPHNNCVDEKRNDIDNNRFITTTRGGKRKQLKRKAEMLPKPCVHQQSALSVTGKAGNSYISKGKPTASVVPLIKRQSITTKETHPSDAVSGSSQVLLLPISLNPSPSTMSGGSASLPIFALHSTSVKLDLMRCLDNSQLVNVAPMLAGSSGTQVSLSPSERLLHHPRYYVNPKIEDHVCKRQTSYPPFDQDEPLNLKLGESSIPSGGIKNKNAHPTGRNYAKKNTPKLWRKQVSIMSNSLSVSAKNMLSSNIAKSKFQLNSSSRNLVPSILCKDIIRYDAYSPSSESSCSTDLEEGSASAPARGRKKSSQINLRCKAAPAPGTDEYYRQQKFSPYERETPKQHKSTKARLKSNETVIENNGWIWEGKPYEAPVYSVQSGKPVIRLCYPSMRRKCDGKSDEDDVVMVRDCVIMRADAGEQPYVAKVAALWSQPGTGTMMISLLWFYRPEHTEDSRVLSSRYNDSELFASRHLDEISVACVEDKCFVLTYNQYCRFQALSEKSDQACIVDGRNLVPAKSTSLQSRKSHLDVPVDTDKSLVYFCRKLYDIKLHRLLKTFPFPTPLFYQNSTSIAKSTSYSDTN